MKKLLSKLPKWNTPTEGKFLTLKEWLIYCVGGCGAMGATVFITYYTLSWGTYIAAALDMDVDHILQISYITSFCTILTSPLMSYIIDNTNTKIVAPTVYKYYGYVKETDVLYNSEITLGIISTMCIIGAISGALSIIPYLFYDLKDNAHKKIMEILEVRAKYEDGLCDEKTRDWLEERISNDEENVLDYFKEKEVPTGVNSAETEL